MMPINIAPNSLANVESGNYPLPDLSGLAQLRSAGQQMSGTTVPPTDFLLLQQSLMNQSLLQMMALLLRLMDQSGNSSNSSPSPVATSESSGGGSGAASAAAKDSAPSVGGNDMGNGWVSPLDKYTISSGFGPRKPPTAGSSSNHKGLDMAAPMNTPVRAAKAGTVTLSRDDSGGYGKWIEVKHADGSRTRYPHLNSRGAQVGDQVAAGQVIGKVGSTGNSTGPHLHFEIIDPSGKNIDPATVLKR